MIFVSLFAPAFACGLYIAGPEGTGTAQTADLRMVYLVGDETTTMVTQVAYQGTASAFAMIIPIPGTVVDDGFATVATEDLNQLIYATDPGFYADAGCALGLGVYGCAEAGYSDTAVSVVGEYSAGPYTGELLDAGEGADVVGWLQANGYSVPDAAQPALQDYAAQGFHFLAVQLTDMPEAAVVTDLPPLAVTYDSTDVVMPLRLTASSSLSEVEVMVIVASNHRMQPDEPWVTPDVGSSPPIGYDVQDWYNGRLRVALDAVGSRAWGLEFADDLSNESALLDELASPGTSQHAGTYTWVTRYRSYLGPDELDADVGFSKADTDDTFRISTAVYTAFPGAVLLAAGLLRRRASLRELRRR